MKRKLFTFVSLIALLGLGGTAFAQGGVTDLPGGNWTTGTQVQNVGPTAADIVMTVYGLSAGSWDVSYQDVPSGSSVNFLATAFGWPDGSIGSAVVSSDQPILAVTNETNGIAAGQYQGTGTPAQTVNFPLVKNNYRNSGKSTTFFVQNAGDSAAVIYATYTDVDGIDYDWNSGAPVEPNRMIVLNPTDVNFPTAKLGSLTVTASVPLAGVVNEHHISDTTYLQATRGFAPSEAGTVLLIPTIKYKFGGRSTGPIVQNTGGSPANITITYKATGINFQQYANGVPAGQSVVFFENTEVCPAGATCGRTGTPLPAGTLASAVVESTQNIVSVVNESFSVIPPGQRQRVTTTAAFNQALASTEIATPQYKVNHDYKNSGIQLQNTDLVNVATFDAVFSLGGSGGVPVTTYTLHGTIDPGKYVTLFKLYAGLPAGCSWVGQGIPSSWSTSSTSPERFGAVVITANKPIVAWVTEADDDPVLDARQDIKSYEAFSLTP